MEKKKVFKTKEIGKAFSSIEEIIESYRGKLDRKTLGDFLKDTIEHVYFGDGSFGDNYMQRQFKKIESHLRKENKLIC